jgi:hypothetical protein
VNLYRPANFQLGGVGAVGNVEYGELTEKYSGRSGPLGTAACFSGIAREISILRTPQNR